MRSFLLAAATVASIATAKPVVENRKVDDFKSISVSGGLAVEVKKGAIGLTLDGDSETLEHYTVEVKGGTLQIHRKNGLGNWGREGKLTARITMPAIEKLDASGGVTVKLDDVPSPKMAFELSGGVELDAPKIDAETLKVEASGGVNARIGGKAKSAVVDLSGGVNLKAKSLEIADATVEASGGCDLEITVKDSLTGEISGGVGMRVAGHPPKGKVSTSGGAGVSYL